METAESYIRRIRNPNKRLYARLYLDWLRKGCAGDEPERQELNYMAAQAVRRELGAVEAKIMELKTRIERLKGE